MVAILVWLRLLVKWFVGWKANSLVDRSACLRVAVVAYCLVLVIGCLVVVGRRPFVIAIYCYWKR